MPAIKRDQLTETTEFQRLRAETSIHQEDSDCVVKMTALALDIPYRKAHKLCAKYGRKPRKGMYPKDWLKMLKDSGLRLVERDPKHFINRYPGRHATALKGVTTHHPDRFNEVWADGKGYILHCRRHVAYVKDGVNHDWTRGSAKRVIAIYEVIG